MGQATRDSEKSLFVSLVVTILIIAAGLIVFLFFKQGNASTSNYRHL